MTLKARRNAGFFVCVRNDGFVVCSVDAHTLERNLPMAEVAISQIWLAILIASVSVFFASAIMWMVLPHHKKDMLFLKDKEAGFIDSLKTLNLAPGLYMYPGCDQKDMKDEAVKAKWNAGPWGTLIVHPCKPTFGKNLAFAFFAYALITVFVGYITGLSMPAGSDYMEVFRVAGTTAILGHCMGGLVNDVFIGRPRRFIITNFFDGVVYALITAGIIASMWPGVSAPDAGGILIGT
jgi:hypothetical protein